MNKFAALVLGALLLLTVSARAATLDAREVAQIKSEIASMYEAFEQGDANVVLAMTHESVFALAGGKEVLEKATQQAMAQLLASGIKFVSSKLGAPTKTYLAGEEEACFVPRISVMEIQGKQAKSIGFMIAIRKLGTHKWKYVDGAGIQKNPETLYRLLPKLEQGVELPPVSMELL